MRASYALRGAGDTPLEAMNDYAKRINMKTITFIMPDGNFHAYEVPELETV
jgi:hypothetical protein